MTFEKPHPIPSEQSSEHESGRQTPAVQLEVGMFSILHNKEITSVNEDSVGMYHIKFGDGSSIQLDRDDELPIRE